MNDWMKLCSSDNHYTMVPQVQSGIPGIWETSIPVWAPKIFYFQLYFNKKYVEVAINDFTVHLIISKWLRIQKCKRKRKTMRQRG